MTDNTFHSTVPQKWVVKNRFSLLVSRIVFAILAFAAAVLALDGLATLATAQIATIQPASTTVTPSVKISDQAKQLGFDVKKLKSIDRKFSAKIKTMRETVYSSLR